MNRRINTNYENNLRNAISDFILNNLNQFSRNNESERNTREHINYLSQSNNNLHNQLVDNILDSLNRNMLLYHVNISEYLSSINTILNLISNENNTDEQPNNIENQNRETNTQNEEPTQTQVDNEDTNEINQNNDLRARNTYYYHSNPGRTNISTQHIDPINNERSDIWRRWAVRTPISRDNINSPHRPLGRNNRQSINRLHNPLQEYTSEQTIGQPSRRNIQQRSQTSFYRYLSNENDRFINNELMQEYFQNLFQNVVVSPTSEQIENATEVFSYTNDLDLINHSCPITLEEFQENDNIRRIRSCGHCFNEESIQQWFRRNVRCPVCRLDIRDVSENIIERLQVNTNVNNRTDDETDEDTINEDTLNYGAIGPDEYIPSPRPLRPTLSDISVSTSSTINDVHMDILLTNFADTMRDNLTENLENIMQPVDGNISSHIQFNIPFEQFSYESLYDLSENIFSHPLP